MFFSAPVPTEPKNTLNFSTAPTVNETPFYTPSVQTQGLQETFWKAKQQLDKYLSVTGPTVECREYVSNRLKGIGNDGALHSLALAEGTFIANYSWKNKTYSQLAFLDYTDTRKSFLHSGSRRFELNSKDDGHSVMEETLAKIRGKQSGVHDHDLSYNPNDEPVSDALVRHLFVVIIIIIIMF